MSTEDQVMVASHDPRLVALSVFISILAAYAARDLSERVRDARGRTWLAWLIGGATASGIGIWSMHFTGMLAFHLPVPVQYDWPTVLLSLLVGIIGSAAALSVVSRSRIGWPRALAASIFLGGVGISGLHYTGMAAMRLQGMHHHSPAFVTLSVVLAIVISLMALSLTFLFPDGTPGRSLRNHGSALLMGAANPVMHYTAMAGVSFTYSGEVPDSSHTVSISSLGIVGISIVPVMVLVVALLTSLVDRLQKQRALLDELFEQAPQAVAWMSADNRVVRVNRGFTRVFGYSPQETLGRSLDVLIVPDELRAEARRDADLVAHGERVETEGVRQRKDGSRLHVSILGVPVSVPGGQIGRYTIYNDITERKRAEEKLRRSEALLAEAQELAHIGSWNWDLTSGAFHWSDEHYRIFGFEPQEPPITPERAWDRVHPEDRARIQDLVDRAIRDRQPYECTFRLLHEDGTVRIVQARGRVAIDEGGTPVRMFGTIQDITERKRAEAALSEGEEKYRRLVDLMPVAVYAVDADGVISFYNDRAAEIWGYSPEVGDAVQRYCGSFRLMWPDGRPLPHDRSPMVDALRDGTPFRNQEVIIEQPGGRRIHVLANIDPVRDPEGRIVGAINVFSDVTILKRAEQEREHIMKIMQTFSRRLLEVQEVERRHLARELHDEVGQSLTGLRLLLKPDGGSTTDAARARFEQARGIADELLERVRELSFDLRPAALDQLGLLPALLAIFERFTEQTGVQIHFKHQGVEQRFAPEVETTAYRIVQESLTNVARHAGVTDVTVRVWATADLLSVQIEDRGRGFDPEAALATPRSSGLLGMQERVILLDGVLTVESRPGDGTQITAELPLP